MSKQPYRVIIPVLFRDGLELDFNVGGTEESPIVSLTLYRSGQNFFFAFLDSKNASQYVKAFSDKKSVGYNACPEADALIVKHWDETADAHVAKYIRERKLNDIDYLIWQKETAVASTQNIINRAKHAAEVLPIQEAELATLQAQRASL